MATYKVLQDIEAEDKFIGPLTLKQFIYGAIFAVCAYLSFFTLTRGVWFVFILLAPIMFVAGFLAFPWGRDQPTEVWLLGRLRFLLKPRKRIWNQDGAQQLVTITVPKRSPKQYTNNLSAVEVKSRLKALADTIDSRGWATKNVDISMFNQPNLLANNESDRLIEVSSMPRDVPGFDITASDDMMDEHNNPVAAQLDSMIKTSSQSYRKKIVDKMHRAATDQKDVEGSTDWFTAQPPKPVTQAKASKYATFGDQVLTPGADSPIPLDSATPEEVQRLAAIETAKAHAPKPYDRMHSLMPMSEQRELAKKQKDAEQEKKRQEAMTAASDPVILGLAKRDDFNVSTIARQANIAKKKDLPDNGDEVVISLH